MPSVMLLPVQIVKAGAQDSGFGAYCRFCERFIGGRSKAQVRHDTHSHEAACAGRRAER